MESEKIKEVVKARYSKKATQSGQSCCSSCGDVSSKLRALAVGYSKQDLEHIPEEAMMGLGCGNPTGVAALKSGEVVLDLGSGSGIDVFLAANRVGPAGKVIGVDMTEEMVEKANALAEEHGYANVEFRLGDIEKLPLQDSCVDTVISNCVINLAPDKLRVFREAYRVLRPAGRLVISDLVTERPLPAEMQGNLEVWAQCLAGALEKNDYLGQITGAGFIDLNTVVAREFYVKSGKPKELVKFLSVTVKAYKPA